VAFTVCALVVAGLPPLSGFVAKLAMLSALLAGFGHARLAAWALFGAAHRLGPAGRHGADARAGMRHFWAPARTARRRACA
jgi:multicomponent K+:H+ antiporter subunit D